MKPVGVVALAGLLAGCGGRLGGAGSGAQATNDAAPASLGRGRPVDSGIPGVGPSDAPSIDDHDSISDLMQGPTVWVGQIDKIVTWPYDYDGGSVISFGGDPPSSITAGLLPPSMEPEKVVLILDAKANPLIGTITFGDVGPLSPPWVPNQTPCPAVLELTLDGQAFPSLPNNLNLAPFPGFSYSLVSSTLGGNLLQLAFVPNQVFQNWCVIHGSSMPPCALCICDGGACMAPSSPIRQLTLTVSGDSMQGKLLGLGGGGSDIRLQRVQ